MKKFYTSIFGLVLILAANAQSTFSPGDIAFLGFHSDATERFAFVLLEPATNGTSITFTDNPLSDVGLCTNEGNATWVNNTGSTLAAGTVITITGTAVNGGGTLSPLSNGISLSASGDNIFAYQGTTFIAAIASRSFVTSCPATCTPNPSTNVACVPSNLTVGTNAIQMTNNATEADNGFYNITTFSGTKSAILASINNNANWTNSNTSQTWPSWSLILPVKLQSFTATNKSNTIALDWKVAQESNITTYEVERSINGTDYTTIATVVAQNLTNYSFIDNTPLQGTSYYRLKINEQNGTFNYSPIAKLKLNGKALNINAIYPSPAKDFLKVNINSTATTNATIDIVDFKGKVIISQNAILMNGLTEKSFNITTLKAGMYMIRIIANGDVTIEKFIKQ